MRKVAECSFIHYIYPFLFDATEFKARVERLEATTCHTQKKKKAQPDVPMWVPLWGEKGFPRDDMLAYVAEFLNPSHPEQATARVWKLNDELDEAFGLAGRAHWSLVRGKQKIPFRLGEVAKSEGCPFAVQLALFRVGVGFLTVQVKPESDDVADWLDFISLFRFVKGQRKVTIEATKRTGFNQETKQPEFEIFFPEFCLGDENPECGERHFSEILDGLLRTGNFAEGEEPWWKDVFIPEQMMPFAIVYVDEAIDDENGDRAATSESRGTTREIHGTGIAESGKQKDDDFLLIYKLRTFFNSKQANNPAPEDLAPDHPSLIAYAERCWFIFSLDGGSFIAFDAPLNVFFRQTMPAHLRDQYFLLLLIVLHQRFALMSFSQEVVMKWLTENEEGRRIEALRHIRDRLLDFTAHGLFTQVMQRDHHHRSYRKWQEVFQIKDLYEEVRNEVREMHDYLQLKRTERIKQLAEERKLQIEAQAEAEKAREREAKALAEQRKKEVEDRERAAQERANRLEKIISLLGICFGVPALTISFLGINIPGLTTKEEGLRMWMALVIVLSISAIFVSAILLLLRRYINQAVEDKVEQEKKG